MYEIEDGKVVSSEIVETNGQRHSVLAEFLYEQVVSTVIYWGVGGRAAGISPQYVRTAVLGKSHSQRRKHDNIWCELWDGWQRVKFPD